MKLNRYERIVAALGRAIERMDSSSQTTVDRLYRRVDNLYTHYPVEMTAVPRKSAGDMAAEAIAARYDFCYSHLHYYRTALSAMRLKLNRQHLLPHHRSALLALPPHLQ